MDEVLVGVYSKLDIYVIRFSLILQLSRWACDESDKKEIDSTSVEGAISIVEYFRITAKRVQGITNSSAMLEQLPTDKLRYIMLYLWSSLQAKALLLLKSKIFQQIHSNAFWQIRKENYLKMSSMEDIRS